MEGSAKRLATQLRGTRISLTFRSNLTDFLAHRQSASQGLTDSCIITHLRFPPHYLVSLPVAAADFSEGFDLLILYKLSSLP